ncbi:MAG TPA: hypothetical protein VGS62_03500 [Streptosporangiaceae bacterium]|nr:hypothetical protein [Streptosporangiaceae bacterium]
MSFPTTFLLILAGMIVSAFTKYHGIPALWLFDAALVLGLAAVILCLIRAILDDRPQPQPEPRLVHVITTLR